MRCKDWLVDFQPIRASHFARLGLEAGQVPAVDAGALEKDDLAQGGEDLRGRRGDGFLPQPAQRCLPRRRVGFQEPVEEGLSLVAEQPAKDGERSRRGPAREPLR